MKRRIFAAARVHAMNPRGEGGDAVVVEHGRVTAILPFADAKALAPEAHIVDLGDATITPGLVDAHIHITEWAVARSQVDLANQRTPDDVALALKTASAHEGWVLGRGWNPHYWGGAYPHRTVLDRVAPHVPVALQSHDMHAMWLNTRAVDLIGLRSFDYDPDGGRILRDDNGEPTGVLLENAAQLVLPHLPRYAVEKMIPLILNAQRELHQYGITAIHSFPGVHLPQPSPFPVLQSMHENGQLGLRVLQHISLDSFDDATRVGLHSGFGDDWIRVGGVKMFLDGALGSRSAWMREPYENSADTGVQVMAEADFRDAVRQAAASGIASVVHAIGDAAVMLALEVLSDESMHVRSLPHRVEHVQCLPVEAAKFLTKRVVCSVQPSHLMTDWQAADTHWGARAAQTYAFRFMLDNGATLACGSDAPVEKADPREGLYAAVARKDRSGQPSGSWHPEQRISARDALAAYTTGPAYAAGIPAVLAGLAPGSLADLVAWKTDPLGVAPEELLELRPRATVVGGEIVYSS